MPGKMRCKVAAAGNATVIRVEGIAAIGCTRKSEAGQFKNPLISPVDFLFESSGQPNLGGTTEDCFRPN
jgi:hypothetical protein